MALKDVIAKEPRKAFMLANEAIVRGALEKDVKVVSFYPGSPTVEILETFEGALAQKDAPLDYRMEISVNEKVALETIAGASMVGLRSMTAMKSVGTNVASDALYTIAYTGLRAGCLLVMADDPHAHSSQSEQDGRWFARTAYLPMLEPSTPQEAYNMTKVAFEMSERHGALVIMRTTTRVNHQTNLVQTGKLARTPFKKISWKDNRRVFTTVKDIARRNKLRMLATLDKLREESNTSPFNWAMFFDGIEFVLGKEGEAKAKGCELGIITSGVSYLYSIEALAKLGLKAKVLKLGFTNPLPDRLISGFLKGLKKVIIVEELSPYVEDFVRGIAKDTSPKIEIIGKASGHFSEAFEYCLPIVARAFAEATGTKMYFDHMAHAKKMSALSKDLPPRVPVFCAGCPHRATFRALQTAVGKKYEFFHSTDIGCYSMTLLPPIDWGDAMLCMGAGLGIATGAQYSTDDKVVAIIGDSTLFHAGLPAVVNAVHNGTNMMVLILDNSVTAMTGQQTNPGSEDTVAEQKGTRVVIEKVLEGIGVKDIIHMDSFKVLDNIKILKQALARKGLTVVISHGECALYHFRNFRHAGGKTVPYAVDKKVCKKFYNCIKDFMCPALSIDESDGKSFISEDLCVGCGVCAQLCGAHAIKSTALKIGGEDRPYVTVEDYNALMKKARGVKK
jgi:indolepyruvate ferredoxin oxidoreductase, alpha subunit